MTHRPPSPEKIDPNPPTHTTPPHPTPQSIYFISKCSAYLALVGLLRGDKPPTIQADIQTRLWPIVSRGWKFWPLAHIVTYGLIPPRHRVLWVNLVDLVWSSILASLASNANTTGGGEEEEAAVAGAAAAAAVTDAAGAAARGGGGKEGEKEGGGGGEKPCEPQTLAAAVAVLPPSSSSSPPASASSSAPAAGAGGKPGAAAAGAGGEPLLMAAVAVGGADAARGENRSSSLPALGVGEGVLHVKGGGVVGEGAKATAPPEGNKSKKGG